MTADDGGVCADCRAATNQGSAVFALSRDGAARIVYVRKDHAWSAENIVLQSHCIVHRYVVLDSDVVADSDVISDEDVLTENAFSSDLCTSTDVHPMPNARAGANTCSGIDHSGVVDDCAQLEVQWQRYPATIAGR